MASASSATELSKLASKRVDFGHVQAPAGQHSLLTFKFSTVRAFRLGIETETFFCDGFRAHIRSRHINTQREMSYVARNRRHSYTEPLLQHFIRLKHQQANRNASL